MSKMSINVEYVETVKKNIKECKKCKKMSKYVKKKCQNVKKGQNYEKCQET